MLELLALHKLYKDDQTKKLQYNNYLERFSNHTGNKPPFPTTHMSLLGGIILLIIYIYVFKSAWECYGSIPVFPRILVCMVCCSFWFLYLIFRYLNILKCKS